jgi:hypothetical protein
VVLVDTNETRRKTMLGRAAVASLALGVMLTPAVALANTDDLVLRRDEEGTEVAVVEDDDFTGNTGGDDTNDDSTGDSDDATGSRHTGVSRDRDRSRGDLTRDWTRDGGDQTRDHSRGHTNDKTRNDTR